MKYNASKDTLMDKYPYLSRKPLVLFIIKNESSMVKAETDEQSAFMENLAALNTVLLLLICLQFHTSRDAFSS